MCLTSGQIAEIRRTWILLSQDPVAMTDSFYTALFRIAPEVRPLFAGSDMADQGRKLATAIGLVVRHAGNLAPVVPALHEMGRRHAGYGVHESHYEAVGRALVQTVAEALGPDFTETACSAWIAAYTAVATAMKSGAAEHLKKTA